MVSSSMGVDLTNKENMLLFVCCAAVETKLVKQEICCTVILHPMVSVPWGEVLLYGAEVVVKWSACYPSIPMTLVCIPLK